MLGFPVPYPNELLYSTIARAGIHDGETSPKQLLNTIFGGRNIIASVGLPSHLVDIALQYPEALGLNPHRLISDHTLWPIYAPFIPSPRREIIEQWMTNDSHGAVYSASGVAASRVKQNLNLLICPGCVREQIEEYGEPYWDRRWCSPLTKVCVKHGALWSTDIQFKGEHRHAFIGVADAKVGAALVVSKMDQRFGLLVNSLFQQSPQTSPSYYQWSQFYRWLAVDHGFGTYSHIDHEKIFTRYTSVWRAEWLRNANLYPGEGKGDSWLKAIFRKHRKTFSFAAHATVLDAVTDGQVSIVDAIKTALSLPIGKPEYSSHASISDTPLTNDQRQWLALLDQKGPGKARRSASALYARLYRNQHDWLIHVNVERHILPTLAKHRVNWRERDRQAAKDLNRLISSLEDDLLLPRLSKSYLLHQLPNSALVEKKIHLLPRCRVLLNSYSEDVTEYQARRLTAVILRHQKCNESLKRWLLLREAGLSDVRITDIVNEFLKGMTEE
ncbi:TnsD family Tn7-like transposition protein [Hahella sp. KA22]|uniref:TnsD family Tn7-like transposition protein n=1 Tax=Hahella sp. KA22 TaxID=1628392 RepID=UPI0013E3ADA7|nr:TnsD family Tn7-like transposition protein [Hahella sp. KA22]